MRMLVRAALLLSLVASAVKPALAGEPVASTGAAGTTTQEHLRRGLDLWHVVADFNGALEAFNAAVDSAPGDVHVRLVRAQFLEEVSRSVVASDKQKFEQLARDDYQAIAQDAKELIAAGVARDGLARLAGPALLDRGNVPCPDEALAAFGRAEALFATGQHADAVPEYEAACAGCPASSACLVALADTYYAMNQYSTARDIFRKALAIHPWNRSAHRYLADTETHLQAPKAALHEAMLAVVSDPSYEAAWESLRVHAAMLGRSFRRVRASKPRVTSGEQGDRNIELPPEMEHGGSEADLAFWIVYGRSKTLRGSWKLIRSVCTAEYSDAKPREVAATTALDIERAAIRAAVPVLRELEPGPVGAMLDRAERAGFLDEAIFLHLLDEPLAAEYPAFREQNSERLVTYLKTVVVPKH